MRRANALLGEATYQKLRPGQMTRRVQLTRGAGITGSHQFVPGNSGPNKNVFYNTPEIPDEENEFHKKYFSGEDMTAETSKQKKELVKKIRHTANQNEEIIFFIWKRKRRR